MHWTSAAVSTAYAACRPRYDERLVEGILKHVQSTQPLAVDVGCGTGQLATLLAPRCAHVFGVDPSPSQIAAAVPGPNLTFHVGSAEEFRLNDVEGKIDVVTIAQALHWMDMKSLARRLNSLLQPKGVLALITYTLVELPDNLTANNAVKALDEFLRTQGYWPRERGHVDDKYQRLLSQLSDEGWGLLNTQQWSMINVTSPQGFMEYVETWSGVQQMKKHHPSDDKIQTLKQLLQSENTVHFPLTLYILQRRHGAEKHQN